MVSYDLVQVGAWSTTFEAGELGLRKPRPDYSPAMQSQARLWAKAEKGALIATSMWRSRGGFLKKAPHLYIGHYPASLFAGFLDGRQLLMIATQQAGHPMPYR